MNSFKTLSTLSLGSNSYEYFSLKALEKQGFGLSKLPFSIKILLENLLRNEDGKLVRKQDVEALAVWRGSSKFSKEIPFLPARVLMQDFTGVPAVVDLAAMRDAIAALGGDPKKINPLVPVDLVVDHSVQVDRFGTADAFQSNVAIEFERNKERYSFLKWGQSAFQGFRVVPPGTGIVHQVNLEYLANVVFRQESGGKTLLYPDTVVGTDSHTTMINGLGVLGWGVGGIEAEAAMLGQPSSMVIPEVVGFELKGKLREGATATDAVLTVTQMLRKKGVVGKFVEFYGEGLNALTLADRATIANMAPEYGATMGFFPVDKETLAYLRFSGRDENLVKLVEAYCREQGLFWEPGSTEPEFSDKLSLDLSSVEPSLAGPKRPQDRLSLSQVKPSLDQALQSLSATKAAKAKVSTNGHAFEFTHGAVVIAAITSCTNTSNPSVMVAAGLLAKKAVEKGLTVQPWVKTSLAPGSKVVTDYLIESGLMPYLEKLNFHLVGYGCTTCIGNSGPLPPEISKAVKENDLAVSAVLSGNRNFEGRVNPQCKLNYLASPPLVVAYALAGRMDVDLTQDPLGTGKDGKPVYLKDVWPTQKEISDTVLKSVKAEMFKKEYGNVFEGDALWQGLSSPKRERYSWDSSTYIKEPPYFAKMPKTPGAVADISNARVLAIFGDSVTTDHISPAGSIPEESPAGKYLIAQGLSKKDFNSYGARRGNHEVMMRGTFANIRIKNLMVPGTEGGWTVHAPTNQKMWIYDAAMAYASEKTPLIVLAGKEYGAGSSRDWAAKGPALLGVRAVIAESFERIHRSNLVGMGVLPLQFLEGENAQSLGLTGFERFSIEKISGQLAPGAKLNIQLTDLQGKSRKFSALLRIDTPIEVEYYRHGGILPYVLRQLLGSVTQ